MKDFRHIWIAGLAITALIIVVPIVLLATPDQPPADDPRANIPDHPQHTDHAGLVNGPFETGSDVTRACLTCHEDAATQVMGTTHWTWQAAPVEVAWSDEPVSTGKANVINNFCIGIQSNWSGCTSCHAGYGWDSADFDFKAAENVDCLVCHAQAGYAKSSAGMPAEGSDLLLAAQSVAIPTRENCGSCHFNGGGGDAVKHGDLDQSLNYPSELTDVHMGRYDFQCTDCHRTADHQIGGRSISVSVDDANQVACADCHSASLHQDDRITAHVETVACQTCHIPAGAVREPTKMYWDWSTAGDTEREQSVHEYLAIKGSFVYEANFTPEYGWYNGTVADRYLLGDLIDPEDVTVLNPPAGNIDDLDAQIWPFKVHRARQIYDSTYNWLIQPNTVGGYWVNFDWDEAARDGMATVGLPYSGSYGFASTEMYWPLSHMVMPSERALQCTDCHGDNSRLDWEALGYPGDPMNWGGRDADSLAAVVDPNAN